MNSSSGMKGGGAARTAASPGRIGRNKKLLFIGGATAWFSQVRQLLLERRPDWTVEYVADHTRLPPLLTPLLDCDAVVLHDSKAGSTEWLAAAKAAMPWLLTISISKQGKQSEGNDRDAVSESVETVLKACWIDEWMSQPSMKLFMARIKKLPTIPRLLSQVTEELQSSEGSLELVSQYVRKDPVMAAKFLQVVNSVLFGLAYTISDPGEAVMLLGTVRTKALILSAGIFSQFEGLECFGVSTEAIWQHSLRVASFARGIALTQTEDAGLAETAFTAGLVHDIGKLLLVANASEMYTTAGKLRQLKNLQECEAELFILGTTHAELGACLLGTWQLPLAIIEAVAWHHRPSESQDQAFSVLTAVHAGNVLAHESSDETNLAAPSPRFDIVYLVRLGLAARRNAWREVCGIKQKDEVDTVEETARRRFEAKDN